MPIQKKNPINETTEEARSLAQDLLAQARFGALGVLDPETGAPMVSRIAIGQSPDGQPLTLISDLSHHAKALKEKPICSVLLGEPGPKGDPLTHPRITLQAQAHFIRHGTAAHKPLRAHYLTTHPKAQLYIDFADFAFALFTVEKAHLNGGFGKAFTLTPQDLGLA